MIAMIPWVKGSRECWKGDGYTVGRVRFIVEQFLKACPDVPLFIATPHIEHAVDLMPARIIDCSKMLEQYRLVECGVMLAAYHPLLHEVDVLSLTADTLVVRDPRPAFPEGLWSAPQQHLPKIRPYGDWIVRIPPRHKIRPAVWATFTRRPQLQYKFDRFVIASAIKHGLTPNLVTPPTIMNGEWIAEGWEPWCQPLTEATVAVHPHSHTKWPEFADTHPYFAGLRDGFARPLTDMHVAAQMAAHGLVSGKIPTRL